MRRAAIALAAGLALSAGCATARSYLALRQVHFDVDRAVNIRLAGLSLDQVRSVADIGALDGARLAAAFARGVVPLEFDLLVLGENPETNRATARLVRMEWTLLLNGTETITGVIDTAYTFRPGQTTVMRVPVSFDLVRFFRTSGRDAIELALGLSGQASRPTEITLRALPTIDTPLGSIQYPGPITVVRRTVGGP